MRVLVTVASAVVAVLLAGGCAGDSEELVALRSDPMADVELQSGERVAHRETDAGVTLGKPVRAEVTQAFVPSGDADLAEVLDEAVASARAAGWDLQPVPDPEDFWEAERAVDTGVARLQVYVTDATNPGRVVVHVGFR